MSMSKKGIMATIAVLILTVVFGAYFYSKYESKDKPIVIGTFVYPGYATFYVAQEKGFFKKYGVNVELKQIPLDSVIPALASGEIQMLSVTSDMMSILSDAGIDAQQIFVTSKSYGADGLAVTSDIKSFNDLKGKKVYVGLGFPNHMFSRNLQKQAGLKLSDIELINLDPELAAASFIAGKANAVWTWEPYLSQTKSRKDGHILVTSKDEPNLMPEDNMVARRDLIINRREDVKNVMRAFFDAQEWWINNVDEGDVIAAKAFNITKDDLTTARQYIIFSNFQANLNKFDNTKPWNVAEQATRGSEVYFEDGLIKSKIKGDLVTDGSLLKELNAK